MKPSDHDPEWARLVMATGESTSAKPNICAKCHRVIDGVGAGATICHVGGQTFHIGCAPGRSVDDNSLRLRRIEVQLRDLQDEVREQASGSQDGYLLDVANRIRSILA